MAIISIASNKLEVFPTSIARPEFPYARVLTEDHILDMIRSVSTADSYVLTETYSASEPLEFVIHGYYVKIDATSSSKHAFTGTDVYAHIFIDTTSPTHPQLHGTDDGTTFSGITFNNSETCEIPQGLDADHVVPHTLHLLHGTGKTYSIPVSSKKCIDGGEID